MKRGRGRPPIDPSDRRTERGVARLSEREADLMRRLADHLGTSGGDVLRLGLEALAREHGLPA